MHEFDHWLAVVILLASLAQAFAVPETLKGLQKMLLAFHLLDRRWRRA